MHSTHLELFKAVLGDRFNYLEKYYENLKPLDIIDTRPIGEPIFDQIFPSELCSKLFGTPNTDRSDRPQRKMDLAVLREIYHLWKDKNYFDISPTLTTKLIDTELRDVDTFFIRAPYRSMYLSLPKGNGLFIPNNKTGLHEVESIYLTFEDFGEPKSIIVPFQNKKFDNTTKHIHMLVCGETKGTYGDAIMFFDLIFFEGKVSESITLNKDLLDNPTFWDSALEVFNFVSKVLLYINCSNTSIQKIAGLDLEEKLRNLKSNTKKRKLIQKYCRISPEAHNLLDVVINHDHGVQSKNPCASIALGPKAFEKVRPHFKTQRYGTALSQSKIIWVESYVRGEGAEFFRDTHNFKVT